MTGIWAELWTSDDCAVICWNIYFPACQPIEVEKAVQGQQEEKINCLEIEILALCKPLRFTWAVFSGNDIGFMGMTDLI